VVEITNNGGGRWRLFYLAIPHQDHYSLAKLITGYPGFGASNYIQDLNLLKIRDCSPGCMKVQGEERFSTAGRMILKLTDRHVVSDS